MLLMSSHPGDHGALPLDPGAHTKDQLVHVVTRTMSANDGDGHTKQFEVPHATLSRSYSRIDGLNMEAANYIWLIS